MVKCQSTQILEGHVTHVTVAALFWHDAAICLVLFYLVAMTCLSQHIFPDGNNLTLHIPQKALAEGRPVHPVMTRIPSLLCVPHQAPLAAGGEEDSRPQVLAGPGEPADAAGSSQAAGHAPTVRRADNLVYAVACRAPPQ